MVSNGVTVGGRLSESCMLIASSRLVNASSGPCVDAFKSELVLYLGVVASPELDT